MEKVIIYTANPCPYCSQAKALLKRRGVVYTEIHLDYDDDKAWDDLTAKTGLKTVPQIFNGEKLIGGYSDLAELDSQDELASLKAKG